MDIDRARESRPRGRRARRRVPGAPATVALAVCVIGATVACSPGGSGAPAETGASTAAPSASTPRVAGGRELFLGFDRDSSGGQGTSVQTTGTVPTSAEVRTHGRGTAQVVRHSGGGQALRLPAFVPGATTADVPVAVVVVTPTGPAGLDPGSREFVLGASVRLDPTTAGSVVDNGDNLVQRGTYGAPAQMKLQVDSRRPSCRVKGADGDVTVVADRRLAAGRWFSLACRRTAAGVTLVQRRTLEDGRVEQQSWTEKGRTGSMSALPARVPLTVGGKTDADGDLILASSDQLNGSVDRVFLDVLD